MDIIRGIWYTFMTTTGFTNAYRYDHILSRSDDLHTYDIAKMAMNINRKDSIDKAKRCITAAKLFVDACLTKYA